MAKKCVNHLCRQVTQLSRSLLMGWLLLQTANGVFMQEAVAADAGTKSQAKAAKSSAAAKANDIAGLAFKVVGNWNTSFGKQVKAVRQGDVILNGWKVESPQKEATITIVLVDGRRLKFSGGTTANAPVTVPKTPSVAESWLSATFGVFNDPKDDQWVVAMSRAVPSQLTLQDAVVKNEAGKIDLTDVCKSLPNGEYFIRLVGMKSEGAKEDLPSGEPVSVAVTKGKSPTVALPKNLNGIYRVMLGEKEDEPTSEAWVLVTNPQKFKQHATAFQRARTESQGWEGDIHKVAIRDCLRAYMVALNK